MFPDANGICSGGQHLPGFLQRRKICKYDLHILRRGNIRSRNSQQRLSNPGGPGQRQHSDAVLFQKLQYSGQFTLSANQ